MVFKKKENEQWQENFWSQNDNTVKVTGVSLLFKNKKDRDYFLENVSVVFQNQRI